jgi:hypothetical protein
VQLRQTKKSGGCGGVQISPDATRSARLKAAYQALQSIFVEHVNAPARKEHYANNTSESPRSKPDHLRRPAVTAAGVLDIT